MNTKRWTALLTALAINALVFAQQADTTDIKNTWGYKIGFQVTQYGLPLLFVGGLFFIMLHLHRKTKERERNGGQ